MRRFRINTRVLFGVVTILLILAILTCIVISSITAYRSTREHNDKVAQIGELYHRKTQLESQYNGAFDKVFNDPASDIACGANVSLIFLDIDEVLYHQVYPTVKSKSEVEMSGVLCFSPEEIPGMEGRITLAQYNQMIQESKWDTALFWTAGTFIDAAEAERALEEYLILMQGKLEAAGVPMPRSFVFDDGAYASKFQTVYNDLLISWGIKHIVHHGEGEQLNIMEISGNSTMFRPGAVGWKADYQQKYYIQRLVVTGGCSALTVSFKEGDREIYYNTSSPDHNGSFGRMLDYIGGYVTRGQLNVMNFSDAWRLTLKYQQDMARLKEIVETERQDIIAQIREIDAQIIKKYSED